MISSLLHVLLHFVLSFLIYFVVKYRYKNFQDNQLKLSQSTIKKLIKTFKPIQIVPETAKQPNFPLVTHNFTSFDFFGISNSFKKEIKKSIRENCIGSCGPRGFFGTFPAHLRAERRIAEIFNKQSAILYSNYYTAVQSVIDCFCRNKTTIFYCRDSCNAIMEEVEKIMPGCVEFDSLNDLEENLKCEYENKWVVAEHLAMNTGRVLDVGRLVELKKAYKFRVILDVSLSYPMLFNKGIEEFQEIDVIVGALSYGYGGNGGFSCGIHEVVEYQRIKSAAYTFSASMSGFQAKFAECAIRSNFEYGKLENVRIMAQKHLKNIISDDESAMVLVKCKDSTKLQRRLASEGYLTGINGEYLRICLNVNHTEEAIKKLSDLIQVSENMSEYKAN